MHQRLFLIFITPFLTIPLFGQYQDSIYTSVDQMPYFPGCTAYEVGSDNRRKCSNNSVKAFIFNQIIYPQTAKEAGIEGAVYVRFTVDEQGKVVNPQVLKDIGGGCGEVALQMLQAMPQWEPAIHRGRRVKVELDLPIHFYFKDDKVDLGYGYTLVWGDLKNYEISRKDLRKNLNESLTIFNSDGEQVTINELSFSYNKNNRITRKASNGRITKDMESFVKKLKKGGYFSVIATIQKEGSFIEVDKEFVVVK